MLSVADSGAIGGIFKNETGRLQRCRYFIPVGCIITSHFNKVYVR
jgi:hypothetical protein